MKLRHALLAVPVAIVAFAAPAAAAPDTTPPVLNYDVAPHYIVGQNTIGSANPDYLRVPARLNWNIAEPSGLCNQYGDIGTNGEEAITSWQSKPYVYAVNTYLDNALANANYVRNVVKDCAGNEATYTKTYTANIIDDSAAAYSPTGTRWIHGTASSYTDLAGSTATLNYTGNSIAVVAPVRVGRGKATVTIDGISRGTIDYSKTAADSQIVYSWYQITGGAHTIQIRATSGRIDVSKFVVS